MRHVYFSFHFSRDIMRANQVRNSGLVFGARSIGFADRSLWEKAKTRGNAALERLIDDGLSGSSVTAVLIGRDTASRRWVRREIEKSVDRGNAILGIRIHHLKAPGTGKDLPGPIPAILRERGSPIYTWANDAAAFGEWVEKAFQEQCASTRPDYVAWALAGGAIGLGSLGLAAWLKKKPAPTGG